MHGAHGMMEAAIRPGERGRAMAQRRIQACLNGARARGFHLRLPLTPEALAADAAACAAAGAVAVHLHPRDAAGAETLAPEAVGAAVAAVRRATPGLHVSVSTGEWIERDDARQMACLRAWAALPGAARPDEASVNLAERRAPEVMRALMEGGIGVEAGLASVADAERLMGLGLLARCRRVLVEMEDVEPAAAAAVAAGILARIGAGGPERQLHGFGRSAWPMARRALALGLMLRLGMEDTAELPDGSPAADNAALVVAGMRL
jgi:uncharacterized protein (DUF849 family)